jgi:hypothetical protein
MLYLFRPRMFVANTLFEPQEKIYTMKLNFVLTLCYYSIHRLAFFIIAVSSAGQYQNGVHAILSLGSDTSAKCNMGV